MPAEILSLDLDWFNGNWLDDYCISFRVREFFQNLRKSCNLPSTIHWATEHQYLYPWCLQILKRTKNRKLNVINIDEHHDFYYLTFLDFDSSFITCGNFFGFMSHRKLLGSYTWVSSLSAMSSDRTDCHRHMSRASSKIIQAYRKKIEVVSNKKVFGTVSDKIFDGFMIVMSPEYTKNKRRIFECVRQELGRTFPFKKIQECKLRRSFCPHETIKVQNKSFAQV